MERYTNLKDKPNNIQYSDKYIRVNHIGDDTELDIPVSDNDDLADETTIYSTDRRITGESTKQIIKRILFEDIETELELDNLKTVYPNIGVEKIISDTKSYIKKVNNYESNELKQVILNYIQDNIRIDEDDSQENQNNTNELTDNTETTE